MKATGFLCTGHIIGAFRHFWETTIEIPRALHWPVFDRKERLALFRDGMAWDKGIWFLDLDLIRNIDEKRLEHPSRNLYMYT